MGRPVGKCLPSSSSFQRAIICEGKGSYGNKRSFTIIPVMISRFQIISKSLALYMGA